LIAVMMAAGLLLIGNASFQITSVEARVSN
jgi:hypothetical protein